MKDEEYDIDLDNDGAFMMMKILFYYIMVIMLTRMIIYSQNTCNDSNT